MPRSPIPPAQDFVPYATAALDLHRELNLSSGSFADLPPSTRGELDALHAHLVSLHALLDAHARRTSALPPARPDLVTAAHRIWQAADVLHAAYHAASRDGVRADAARRRGLPDGAPLLSICQRHQRAIRLARRRMTPTDVARP
ncbi:DUF6238 family protein [Streptomyces sp. NPDC021224]|uniref:DUF6238 family protein n=1 Tax=unclassified Streptomyces TaxID=2593676 RepID=UPI0037A70CBF